MPDPATAAGIGLKDIVTMGTALLGAGLGVYNAVIGGRDKAAERERRAAEAKKAEEREKNPISVSLMIEWLPDASAAPNPKAKIPIVRLHKALIVRIVNVLGRPLSIERPYLQIVGAEREIPIPTPERFPLLLPEGGAATFRVPLDHLLRLQAWLAEQNEAEIFAICDTADERYGTSEARPVRDLLPED